MSRGGRDRPQGGGNARWALSFADLCLLLLGFLVLMQARAGDPRQLAEGLREGFAPRGQRLERRAAELFEPGEAILRPAARERLAALAARDGALTVESRGIEPGTARFDQWELAAARTAAVARALGAAPQRVTIRVSDMSPGGQRLTVVRR